MQSSKISPTTKTIKTPPSSSPLKKRKRRSRFLDVLVRREANKLQTSVYQKPTHTDRYIQFSSNHHPRILRGVIQCLRDRAHNICDGKSKPTELKHLKKVFTANGYPPKAPHGTHPQTPHHQEPTNSTNSTGYDIRE